MNRKQHISKWGYSDNSPYNKEDELKIHTPSGYIDMSQTGIPLFANGILLQPYSGQHYMGTTNVTEIPAVQNGGSLPKAQDGLFTLDNLNKIINPYSTIVDTGINIIKNKIADNVNPFGYNDVFERVYDAIFTTENKELHLDNLDADNKIKTAETERRDLLHMLMGLDQENNSIKAQTQYVPSRGHNEGNTYYTSPHTEQEIKDMILTIGKNAKDLFYENYTGNDVDKMWNQKQQEDLDWEIFARLYYDQEITEYNGKEVEYYDDLIKDDPDQYVSFKDIPQYKDVIEADEYTAWSKDIMKSNEEIIDYPDIESLMTTAGDERNEGGFYGGVLGTFTLNQGEDEQGKYFSYYDKWDLSPFQGWKEKISDFAQKNILGTKPASIYNRMYYTQDEDGNYVFKDGGSLPKAQTGFSVAGPLYDSQGKCFANCQQRYYEPKHNFSIGTKLDINKQGIGMGGYGGYEFNPSGGLGGFKGYLGANYGATLGGVGFSDIGEMFTTTDDDYQMPKTNITPYSSAVLSGGYTGEVGDAKSFKNYLKGRRGDPLKWGLGVYGNYDLLGDFGLTVGGYANYGKLGVTGGYNPNSGWSGNISLGIPIRQQGGSLPKAQPGTELAICTNGEWNGQSIKTGCGYRDSAHNLYGSGALTLGDISDKSLSGSVRGGLGYSTHIPYSPITGHLGLSGGTRFKGDEQSMMFNPIFDATGSVGIEGEFGGNSYNWREPWKYGAGIYGRHDLIGGTGTTAGLYGNIGLFSGKLGYNPNTGFESTLGFGIPIRQDGGSLPQFQKKGETTYPLEIIQYPLGYSSMPPGHIEARLLDIENLPEQYQNKDLMTYINRWIDSGGNKRVTYDADRHYEEGVRTAIMNLSEADLENFMKQAQSFTEGDQIDIPGTNRFLPTSFGGDESDYDLFSSNCATGVCLGLGYDESDYETLGITTPQQVMDAILKDKRTKSSTGSKNYGEAVLQAVLNPFDALTNAIDESAEFFSEGTISHYVAPTKEEIEAEALQLSKNKKQQNQGRTANLARGESTNKYGSIVLNNKIIWRHPNEPKLETPTYNPNWEQGGELPKAQDGEETITVNFDDLEKGIKWSESLNGTLMKNTETSASGYYGDLFDNLDYDGTRDEFIADTDYQEEYFRQRAHGEIEDMPGLLNNGIELLEEYKDVDHGLSALEISALSNMLGRQGTREYLGNVIRDGDTLAEVFPHLYGEDVAQTNKTPQEYIDKFNEGLLKKRKGGEVMTRIKRLNQQLKLYNKGGKISPLAKRQLESLNMIKPKMQEGGQPSIEHHSYIVKKGDNLTRIARDNNMSLSDLLILNPKYMDNPSKIYSGDRIAITENATPDDNKATLTYSIKRGDTLSDIATKYGVRYTDIARINNIKDPRKIQPGQTIILPDNANTNDPIINKNIDIAESVYTDISTADVNSNPNVNVPWLKRTYKNGKWENSGKRTTKTGINKMDQADRIIQGMNDIEGDDSKIINYEIKSGDNLSLIAQKNGVTTTQLMTDNNISNPNEIQVGQKIKINKSFGKPYIVIDEKKGRMHLYYPGQDKPTKSYPILTGTNEGDAQTVTKIGIFKDGVKIDQNQLNQAMKDNDVSTIDDLIKVKGYTSEIDWEAGNKQTGAGIYTIGIANEDSGYYDETGQDRKTPSFVLNNSSGSEVPMVIHTVPSWKNKDRINSLTDADGSNNRMTNGCINGTCDALIDLYENPDIGEGTIVYVLPEDAGNNFVYENGEINFYANRENQEAYQTYTDERGDIQRGHGIANKITSNYKPINITFDKNYYQTNSERYDGHAKGEEEEFVNNTQPFLNSIVDNKKFMMDQLGMDGDMYNDLSMIAFGIYGYESGMGDEGSGAENLLKAGLKFTGFGQTSPDVKSKYNTYGVTGENNSVGWTQMRFGPEYRDESEIEAMAKVGITSNDQLMDPANAAKATIAVLYKEYQNQISTEEKNSDDFDIFVELPKKYSPTGGDVYAEMVNKYMDYIDLTETDIDDIDNNVIIKGEYTDDNIESNERMANKPIEEKLLNLGETVEHGYNQAKQWWDEVDLNPFWKSGGEFSTGNQVQFYNDFIDGRYKGTKQEIKSKKMFDKLNRMYYNDSKKTGKHQLDIMKSILGANRRLNN
jgi:LysM repeat protein